MKENNRFKLILILTILVSLTLSSKQTTFRVFFTDKGPDKFEEGSQLYQTTLKLLNERAIKRRLKVRSFQDLITIEDAPIYQKYIDTIMMEDCKLFHKLKWRNYAVFSCDSSEYLTLKENIGKFLFVRNIQLTGELISILQNEVNFTSKKVFNKKDLYVNINDIECESFNYGESYLQNSIMKVDKLHNLGITGDSILIGFLDSGFRWKTHNSMKNANVLAEYDFIQLDSNTTNEKDDVASQDGHGTLVFSCVSGNLENELIGISPNANFILCKTESIPNEIRLEEDNYAAAIEWLEAVGADISSSSLAYKEFDESDIDYEHNDFDGKSTITARVINDAVSRGMICLSASGNTGPESKTLLTPSDADSVISVGAIQINNDINVPAGFTARGPSGDGRIKPDISTLGVQVVCAGTADSNSIIRANGTSLSTPLTAGAVALLLSLFPELTPWEVKELMTKTSENYPEKNNDIGYGNIDIWAASKMAGTIISPPAVYTIDKYKRVLFHIVPDSKLLLNPTLSIKISNSNYQFELNRTIGDYRYAADIPLSIIRDNEVEANLLVETYFSRRTYPSNQSIFTFNINTQHIPCGIPKLEMSQFKSDKRLYLYPSIIFENQQAIRINYELEIKSPLNIEIYSINGELRHSIKLEERNPGIVNYEIAIPEYEQGVYLLSVRANGMIDFDKFVKIK